MLAVFPPSIGHIVGCEELFNPHHVINDKCNISLDKGVAVVIVLGFGPLQNPSDNSEFAVLLADTYQIQASSEAAEGYTVIETTRFHKKVFDEVMYMMVSASLIYPFSFNFSCFPTDAQDTDEEEQVKHEPTGAEALDMADVADVDPELAAVQFCSCIFFALVFLEALSHLVAKQ